MKILLLTACLVSVVAAQGVGVSVGASVGTGSSLGAGASVGGGARPVAVAPPSKDARKEQDRANKQVIRNALSPLEYAGYLWGRMLHHMQFGASMMTMPLNIVTGGAWGAILDSFFLNAQRLVVPNRPDLGIVPGAVGGKPVIIASTTPRPIPVAVGGDVSGGLSAADLDALRNLIAAGAGARA